MHVYPITSFDQIHKKDFEQLVALLELPALGPSAPIYEEISYILAYGGAIFIARKKKHDTILGAATLCLTFTIKCREAIIMHIDVPPQYRGNKIGVQLLRSMEQYARNKKVQRLLLRHPRDDEQAVRVFQEHQFVWAESTGLHEKLL